MLAASKKAFNFRQNYHFDRSIYFAWDSIKIEKNVRTGIKTLRKYLKGRDDITFYVLIGYDTSQGEDLYRVNTLRELGVNPFVMPFNKLDPYQKDFSRWVNRKAIFKTVAWKDYHLR